MFRHRLIAFLKMSDYSLLHECLHTSTNSHNFRPTLLHGELLPLPNGPLDTSGQHPQKAETKAKRPTLPAADRFLLSNQMMFSNPHHHLLLVLTPSMIFPKRHLHAVSKKQSACCLQNPHAGVYLALGLNPRQK
jgi:hypothetical protein